MENHKAQAVWNSRRTVPLVTSNTSFTTSIISRIGVTQGTTNRPSRANLKWRSEHDDT